MKIEKFAKVSVVLSFLLFLMCCSSNNSNISDNIISSIIADEDDDLEILINKEKFRVSPDDSSKLVAVNNFGLKMMRYAIDVNGVNDNLVLSPVSSLSLLAMYGNGLNNTGQARLAKGLGFSSMSDFNKLISRMIHGLPKVDKGNVFVCANAVWVNDGNEITKPYKQVLENELFAQVSSVNLNDISAQRLINNWVSEKTSGMINDIFTPDPGLEMYAVNAIYFDGAWDWPFSEDLTDTGDFYNSDGSVSKVKMMHDDGYYSYYKGKNYQMIRMPYVNNSFMAFFVVPNKGVTLKKVVSSLTTDDVVKFDGDDLDRRKYRVSIPVVSIGRNSIETTQIFRDMSLISISDDFVGVKQTGNLMSEFNQYSSLEINENGTRAAVVNDVLLGKGEPEEPEILEEFKVDRPYLFMVVHRDSKAIIVEALINKL